MIRASFLYPATAGARFDFDYYLDRHVPMVRQKLGAAVKGLSIDHGLGGAQPGTPAAFVVMFHILFDSVDAFQQAFGPHAQAIVADIANYTNAQPTIQVSDVKV